MEDMEQAYREHAQTVYRFLLAKTGSHELAEELTQETFYQAVKSIERFDGSCRISTWLCGIAKNLLYAQYRKNADTPLPLEDAPEPATESAETELLTQERRASIMAAIHGQPEPGRELLYLRLLGGLSFRQIGEVMGQTETWARVTYYRAKTRIAKELSEE